LSTFWKEAVKCGINKKMERTRESLLKGKDRYSQGILNEGGRLNTVDLLIKVAFLNHKFSTRSLPGSTIPKGKEPKSFWAEFSTLS
jgi:hypothetical protein